MAQQQQIGREVNLRKLEIQLVQRFSFLKTRSGMRGE